MKKTQNAGKRRKQPQIVLVLRTAAGAYLLYLAWGLREAAADNMAYLLAVIVFALAGAALLATSVLPLARGEFLRPGESEEEEGGPEGPPETEEHHGSN